MSGTVKDQLVEDHMPLDDPFAARRYFAKFDRITAHLARVAGELEVEGRITRLEARVLAGYISQLSATLRALSLKYLMTGRTGGPLPGAPVMDNHDSGFPVAQELMVMAVDAAQGEKLLAGMAEEADLKDRMVRQILGELVVPVKLQYALSQRLYAGALLAGGLFHARNDPQAQWVADVNHDDGTRRHYLLHWAVYDSQRNLPVIWLMDIEDSGKRPLPLDDRRWPELRAHLMAQSISGLKLVTVATGVDADFDTLHPKRLRRLTLGPMHSHDFTRQSGPLAEVLANANAPDGDDWALVWTLEDLVSDREERVKDGWFSASQRQVWKLDPVLGGESGATREEQMILLPERPYQVLAELNPPGMADVRKFVVGTGGRLMPLR